MRSGCFVKPRSWRPLATALACVAVLAGCATPPPPAPPPPAAPEAPPAPPPAGQIARNERLVVHRVAAGETLASLAKAYLGDAARAWEIAEFNRLQQVESGQVLAIPLAPVNPTGVTAQGVRLITILCYHRVGGSTNRMVVRPDAFDAQMDYLKKNGYTVLRVSELADFLEGKRPIPPRAVAITFDDGHISSYTHAFPILRKYGFPATYYLYTDFLGAREALSWAQIREMQESGLIDFHSHSKTHANLILRLPDESDARYRDRLDTEIRVPRDLIQRSLGLPVTQMAYPYGDANDIVLDRLERAGGFRLGVTVNPGGNAFYAHPFMLRRTMVFGEHDLDAFRGLLQVAREVNLR